MDLNQTLRKEQDEAFQKSLKADQDKAEKKRQEVLKKEQEERTKKEREERKEREETERVEVGIFLTFFLVCKQTWCRSN